ncbi:MAG: CheR family methyltransferase [Pikeienuella sp.]|uniref:CheR family methyltransferase n=1 Tax=Pikeienuella sp. TaxID=2831957 RepID=UPI00391DF4B7
MTLPFEMPSRRREIGPEAFGRIAAALRREAGIALAPEKVALVHGRLSRRVRTLALDGFEAYCDLIESREGAAELRAMVNALTTNVTRFFREPHHFKELREDTLPRLVAAARAGAPATIWSAGCSTGEEPYSIALCLLDLAPDAAALGIRILATDLNPVVLETGRRGVYLAEALEPAPGALVRGRFEAAPPGADGAPRLRAGEALRALIAFKRLNLVGPWPFTRAFDAIFCRNVLIYFDSPTQDEVLRRFAGATAEGGRLFLGHSERLGQASTQLFDRGGVTSYIRNAKPAPAV